MKNEFGVYFCIHLILIVVAYTSFLWVDWKIILIVTIMLQLQYFMIGGCFLTHLEMGNDKNEVFVWYYLKKVFPSLNASKTKFAVRVVLPIIILGLAFLLQIVCDQKPILKL